jgi:hypothetical protein
VLHPTNGNNVSGTVTFTREGEDVKIVAEVEGWLPENMDFTFMNSAIARPLTELLPAGILIRKVLNTEGLMMKFVTLVISAMLKPAKMEPLVLK